MDAVELLREGVGELLERATAAMSDDEVGGLLVELHGLQAQLGAAVLTFTSVFDRRCAYAADGSKSAGEWLARHATPRRRRRGGR